MFFKVLLVEIIYRPLFNLLILFLGIFGGNLGLAIIALTLVIRLLLIKSSLAQGEMTKGMSELQPKMQEIQDKYKDDPKKMSEETMKVMKKHGAGPLKGCLMTLVQIPVFIGLFFVIRTFALSGGEVLPLSDVYSFLSSFGAAYLDVNVVNHWFLGVDLLKSGADFDIIFNQNLWVAILGGALIFIQMKLTMMNRPATPSMPGGVKMPDMTKMMKYFNVFMVLMIGSVMYSMPAGIGLYIITTTVFSVVQYVIQYWPVVKVKLGIGKNKQEIVSGEKYEDEE